MCFSAQASFIAAAVLTVTGVASLKKASFKSEWFLASIPCFFAIQQFSEGTLWMTLGNPEAPPYFREIAEYAFLFFAFIFWPIWIPLSMGVVEKAKNRRIIMWVCLFFGVALALYYWIAIGYHPFKVQVVGHSIQYTADINSYSNIYLAVVFIPLIVSGYSLIKWFSFLVIASFFIADYFYEETFVSVWCFFAAICSLLVYFSIRSHAKE